MGITFRGLDRLEKEIKLRTRKDLIQKVVSTNGQALQNKMVRNADFVKGYQTGATKRSIHLLMQDNGMTAVVRPETEYAPYLEYGTRFMAAQPFVRPSLNAQKPIFINQIKKVME